MSKSMKLYLDEVTGHAHFLSVNGSLLGTPLSSDAHVAEGGQTYYFEWVGEPDYDLIAPDHAAYLCRIRALLADAEGRPELAAEARHDAEQYDGDAADADVQLEFGLLGCEPVVDPDAIHDVAEPPDGRPAY